MTSRFDPPPFMERGSHGEVVNKVLGFLIDWAKRNGEGSTGIILDRDYADTGVDWMKRYQGWAGINPDGGCGPETRESMKQEGFDFIAEAKKTGDEVSSFIQPNGQTLYWAPHIVPVSSRDEAHELVRKSRRRGN